MDFLIMSLLQDQHAVAGHHDEPDFAADER